MSDKKTNSTVSNAVDVMKKAVGNKNPDAVSLGSRGGKARARNLTPEQRREIASKAAKARWSKTNEHD